MLHQAHVELDNVLVYAPFNTEKVIRFIPRIGKRSLWEKAYECDQQNNS